MRLHAMLVLEETVKELLSILTIDILNNYGKGEELIDQT
jgi:hypothetical protein